MLKVIAPQRANRGKLTRCTKAVGSRPDKRKRKRPGDEAEPYSLPRTNLSNLEHLALTTAAHSERSTHRTKAEQHHCPSRRFGNG